MRWTASIAAGPSALEYIKWCHNCLTNRLSSITHSFSFQRLRICLWVFVRIRRFFTKKSSSLFRSSLFKRAQKTQNTKRVKRVIHSLCLKTSNYHKNPNSEFPTPDFSLQKGAKPTNWNLWHMGINSRYVLPENSNLVLDFFKNWEKIYFTFFALSANRAF